MIEIPFKEFPYFTQAVTLDGASYRFQFLWNTRSAQWAVSIFDEQEEALVEGIPMALDQEMLRQYPTRRLPPGQMWPVDPSGALLTIGRDDLKNRAVQLVYVPEAEVAE